MAAGGGKEMEIAIKIAGKVESSFKNALGVATKGLGNITKTIASATAAAAAAVGAMGIAAINVGKEFETSMSQVAATMMIDKTTANGQKAFETLENAARKCGRETAFSATEAAEGLNNLAMAGYGAEKAAAALPTVLNLAGAGAMELDQSAEILTAGMASLGLEQTEEGFQHFADVLAITASKAKTNVSGMGEAITTVGGTAANLKGGAEEVAAALGILADVDLVGAEGGTHLRNMILSLQNPRNADAAKMFKQLGVSAYDAQGNMRGINEIFGDLNSSMSGMNQQQKDNVLSTIFKQTDLAAANAMLKNCGDRFNELYDAAANSSDGIGAAAKMYAIQMDNLEGDISILKSGLSDLGISIYKDANRPLREMTQLGISMVSELSNAYSSGGMEGMVGAVGGCLAEVVNEVASYAPDLINMGVDLISNFVQGITTNSGALAEAGSNIITAFIEGLFALVPQVAFAGIDLIAQFTQSMGAQLPQLLNSGILAVGNFINGIVQRLPMIVTTAIQFIMTLAQGIMSNLPLLLQIGTQIIVNLVSSITQSIPMLIQGGIQLIRGLIQGIAQNLPAIAQAAITIIMALVGGIITALPQIWAAIKMLPSIIREAIFSVNWLEIGLELIKAIGKGIIDGALSIGDSVMNTVKGWFGKGKTNTDASAQGAATAQSYASGITSNVSAVNSAVSGLSSGFFGNVNSGAAAAAGAQAGAAFSDSLNGGISGTSANTGALTIDSATLNANMTAAGAAGATAFTTGLNTGLSAATANTSALTVDTSVLNASLTTAGTNGATALSNGLSSGSATVTQAATTLTNGVNTALNSGWSRAISSAKSAMQRLSSTVTSAARSAASSVKAAFQNMTIRVPKPKLPVISVSSNSVSYGNGGSVSIPKFSVGWNALGGIFDQPTIFNTPAGMQGVGERGPEAILPLDTLWAKMKEILNEAIAANGGASVIDALLEKLKGIGTGGGGNNPELAGAGGPTIQYSPVYNLYGNAGKEEIAEADRMSQAEFNKMMKQYEKDKKRRKL